MKLRPHQLAFALASLCVIAALAAVTVQSLRLERNELRSRAAAEHEASVRLVLWRMDSMLAPILAREAATPYYYYRPFFEASRTNAPLRELASGRRARSAKSAYADIADALIPSPLLQSDSKLVNLYFEVDSTGVNSPQAPEGEFRKLAESNFVSAYRIENNIDRLNRLESVWNRSQEFDAANAVELRQAGEAIAAGEELQSGSVPDAAVALAPVQTASAQPPAPIDAAGARATPAEIPQQFAQQQLSNDYAQRAQVAANSKLTQLEAERSGSQWRRGEDEPAKDEPANVEPEKEESTSAPSATTSDVEAQPAPAGDKKDDLAKGNLDDASSSSPGKAGARTSSVPPPPTPTPTPAPTPIPTGGTRDLDADTATRADQGLATELGSEPGTELAVNAAGDHAAPRYAGGPEQVAAPRDPIQGPLEPRWLTGSDEPTLVLVRQVTTSDGPVTQGLWLNWPELRGALLELASDVFPSATIDPLPGGVANLPPDALNRCLATIPAELRVPEPSIPTPRVFTPVRVALSMAWVVALGAIAASGLALRSATELADRRGQFVSAVTHELRTPLTTFCLYSQMLADGMVSDADAQAQYHSTLHRESQRLTRIVESVLEYARLGKRKPHAKPEATSIAALLDASLPALRERSQACGLELIDTREGDAGGAIRVDRATFDRILSNLVDNACKYAAGSEPPHVELAASVSASSLEIRVRDFGPGIPPSESKRIFDPFFRGGAHSDGATPGLGLGLALCKALAREMGGDLSLIQPADGPGGGSGACFRLVLPRNA